MDSRLKMQPKTEMKPYVRLKEPAFVDGLRFDDGRVVGKANRYGTYTVEVGTKYHRSVIFITKNHFEWIDERMVTT